MMRENVDIIVDEDFYKKSLFDLLSKDDINIINEYKKLYEYSFKILLNIPNKHLYHRNRAFLKIEEVYRLLIKFLYNKQNKRAIYELNSEIIMLKFYIETLHKRNKVITLNNAIRINELLIPISNLIYRIWCKNNKSDCNKK